MTPRSRSLAFLCLPAVLVWSAAGPAQAQPSVSPRDLQDGWAISAPEDQGIRGGAIRAMADRIVRDPVFAHAYSLLVIRHGELVGEAYFNERTPDQRADVRSVTKSVTSMAYGIARSEGRLPRSLETPLHQLLPGYADLLAGEKATITAFDVLTMQAGLRWDDNSSPWIDRVFDHPDLVSYVLGEPAIAAPGTSFTYSTGLTQVLAKVIIGATGQTLADYVQRRILDPLGARNTGWLLRPSGDHYGGLGLQIRPRDMAKLGQLALQNGSWHGRRLVPSGWLLSSTRDQTSEGETYGYQWWAPRDGSWFVAIGYGGQYVFVDRDLDLVVVLQVDYYVPAETHVPWSSFLLLVEDLEAGLLEEAPGVVRAAWDEPPRVGESAGEAVLELERAGGSDGAVEVAYDIRNGSARNGNDFHSATGSLVWRSGESGRRGLAIPLRDDTVAEAAETFDVLFERLTGGSSLEIGRVTVTIEDDDSPARQEVGFGSLTATVREGEQAVLGVERSAAQGALSVAWTAAPLTASVAGPGADLENGSGILSFAPGELVAELRLAAVSDSESEPPEAVTLRLQALDGEPDVALDPGRSESVLTLLDAGDDAASCSSPALCLHGGRFRVRAIWRSQYDGATGSAGGETLSSESGWFWFFSPDRLELLLKILDGRALNDSFWVFFGALTNLEYVVVVEDLETGAVRSYWNRPGSLCGQAHVDAFPSPAAQEVTAAYGRSARRRPLAFSSRSAQGQQLLLLDRFAVEVEWSDPRSGQSGSGEPLPLSTETGLHWFFSPDNVEMALKIVDGRALNGHFWVFTGALTDVDYRITVTDSQSGASRVFENGEALCGTADTSAFTN